MKLSAHIPQARFTGTWTIIWLPQYKWRHFHCPECKLLYFDSNVTDSNFQQSNEQLARSGWDDGRQIIIWTNDGLVYWRHMCDIRSQSLRWRHNGRDSLSNHQPHDCLLNRLFRRRSKKISNSASLAFVWGIHRGPVNSPHKWPVTRKMFPFDDVIMNTRTVHISREMYYMYAWCGATL